MANNLSLQKHTKNKKENIKSHKKNLEKNNKNSRSFFFIISISIIFISSCLVTQKLYVNSNSKDLYFAVEYNFTHGYSKKNKLLRVQYMSLISSDENLAVVEAFGLSKEEPNRSTCIKGNFKKDSNNCWHLDEIIN